MSTTAHVLVLVLAIAATLFVVRLVALRQLRSKYALLWLTIALALVPLAAVPSLLNDIAHGLGFSYAPALLFLLAIGFLFAVVVYLSWELSRMEARIRLLAERMALERAEPPASPGGRADSPPVTER